MKAGYANDADWPFSNKFYYKAVSCAQAGRYDEPKLDTIAIKLNVYINERIQWGKGYSTKTSDVKAMIDELAPLIKS
jgi:hypothetical protein